MTTNITMTKYTGAIHESAKLMLDGSEAAVKMLRSCDSKGVEPSNSDAETALAPRFKAQGMNAAIGPLWDERLDIALPRQELKHIHDRIEYCLKNFDKNPDGLLLAGQRSVHINQLVSEAIHWTKLIRRREDESEDPYPECIEWTEEDA